MRPPLSYIPLLPATTGVVVGILAAYAGLEAWWSAGLFTGGTALLCIKSFRHIGVLLLAAALAMVDTVAQLPPQIQELSLPDEAVGYDATVDDVTRNESGQHLTITTRDSAGVRFKAVITVPSLIPEINPGDRIDITAKFTAPRRDDSPDSPDYAAILMKRGITATAFVRPGDIHVTSTDNSLLWRIKRLRPVMGNLLKRSSLDRRSCEFLTATLTGDDSLMPEESRATFTASGLAHILALSGLHVGILSVVVGIALLPLYLARKRNAMTASLIVILWLYAIVTGLSPSVTRAVIMATTLGIGYILQRRYVSMNALLLAALIILTFDPLQLFNVGFQLSFASVAAILLFTPLLNPVSPRQRLLYYITSLVVVSIAATIGSGVIATYYFHTFPFCFVIANTPVLLMLPLIMGAGVLLIVCEAAGYDPVWLCSAIDAMYNAIFAFARMVSNLPHSAVSGIYFSGWVMIPYFITAGALAWSLWRRKAAGWCAAAAGVVAIIITLNVTQRKFPASEHFIARDSYATDIIYRNGTEAWLITTAGERNALSRLENSRNRHRDFLAMRGVDSLRLAPASITVNGMSRHDAVVEIDGIRYALINADSLLNRDYCHVDYAIVCRGFRGNVLDAHRRLKPDSIMLSADLHVRRHDRYLDSLQRYDIPHRSLRQSTLHHIKRK